MLDERMLIVARPPQLFWSLPGGSGYSPLTTPHNLVAQAAYCVQRHEDAISRYKKVEAVHITRNPTVKAPVSWTKLNILACFPK